MKIVGAYFERLAIHCMCEHIPEGCEFLLAVLRRQTVVEKFLPLSNTAVACNELSTCISIFRILAELLKYNCLSFFFFNALLACLDELLVKTKAV